MKHRNIKLIQMKEHLVNTHQIQYPKLKVMKLLDRG